MEQVKIEPYVQLPERAVGAPEDQRTGERKREPGIGTMPLPV